MSAVALGRRRKRGDPPAASAKRAARHKASKRKSLARAKFLLGEAVLKLSSSDPALLARLCSQLSPKDQALVLATSSDCSEQTAKSVP